jgi:hypothetical protein
MAYQAISTGTSPNDGTGDSLLTGATKVNSNFQELYTSLGNGSSLVPTKFINYTITTTSTNKSLINLEYCTVTSSGLTLTLPSSPSIGDKVMIGIGDNYSNTIIQRNGSNIMGISEDIIIDIGYITITLIYINNTLGWRIS